MMTPVITEKYIPLLQELIRNGCVNDGSEASGAEIRSVRTLERFFLSYGLSCEILSPRGDRASILLKIPGTDPKAPSLMFMGHLDVVPANPEGWRYPPFGGVIAEGRLWGRGSLDMLGQTAAMAVAAAEIAVSNRSLRGDLLFLGVADEEAAGTYGARWLTENHWEKVKADYMITELGGFYLDLPGSPRAILTVGEKGVAQVRVNARGQASHGSLPFGVENATLKIARAAALLGASPPAPVLDGFYRRILATLALPEEMGRGLSHPSTIEACLRKLMAESPGTARLLHACSQMTASPNRIRGGSKVNIIADEANLEVDIRTLPGQNEEDWRDYLQKILDDAGGDFDIEVLESYPSTASPVDTPLMEACRRTAGELVPEVSLVPLLTSVATDGRFWRDRGTCVYGFSLFAEDATIDKVFALVHGRNESISLESLERGYSFLRKLPESFFSTLTVPQGPVSSVPGAPETAR